MTISDGRAKVERTLQGQVKQLQGKAIDIENLLFPNRASPNAVEDPSVTTGDTSKIEAIVNGANANLQELYHQLERIENVLKRLIAIT